MTEHVGSAYTKRVEGAHKHSACNTALKQSAQLKDIEERLIALEGRRPKVAEHILALMERVEALEQRLEEMT